MEYIKSLLSSALAGICIAIGSIAYLICNNYIIGALAFCIGLFMILTFGLDLFTGKLCYIFSNKPRYSIMLTFTLLGNFIGTFISAKVLSITRLSYLVDKCNMIMETKMNDNIFSTLILAIMCNVLIYLAVEGYKQCEHQLGKYLSIIFGVSIFVLCGFEHSIANMFYISFAGLWNAQSLIFILVVILGNLIGGNIFPTLRAILNKK